MRQAWAKDECGRQWQRRDGDDKGKGDFHGDGAMVIIKAMVVLKTSVLFS